MYEGKFQSFPKLSKLWEIISLKYNNYDWGFRKTSLDYNKTFVIILYVDRGRNIERG